MTLGTNNSPVLQAYMADRGDASFIMGPLGSGKTYGSIQKLLAIMCEQQPNNEGHRLTRWLVVRNTYPDLMNTTVKDFRAVFTDDFGRFRMGSLEPPNFRTNFRLEDGTLVKSEVIFLALDRPDAADKIRGFQGTGGWLNEVKELEKAVVDAVHSRMTRYPSYADGGVTPTWTGIFGDTNAPDEGHWYKKLAEDATPEGWTFHRQPGAVLRTKEVDHLGRPVWALNPDAENLGNLHPRYYSMTLQGKEPSWIAINLGNEYGFHIEGDAVHKNYVDSIHCPGLIPYVEGYPLVIGIDFGRTPAAAIIMIDKAFGRKVIIDELCATSMSAELFAPELKRFLAETYPNAPIARVIGDPSGDRKGENNDTSPFMILNAHGIPAVPAQTNAVAIRRAAIAAPLSQNCMDGKPRLFVSSKARMIRQGLMGGFAYRRLHTSAERYTNEPDKNQWSHPVEAAEYGLMGAGEYHEALRTKSVGGRANRSYVARTA